jgi:hypothetical protein
VDLVDKGANQHAYIEYFKADGSISKHGGPGPHKSGSSQDVHGGSGNRGIGVTGNFARGSRGKQKRNLAAEGFPVKDMYPGSRPRKPKRDLTVREDPNAKAVLEAARARQSRVGIGTAGNFARGSTGMPKRNLAAEGFIDEDMYPGSRVEGGSEKPLWVRFNLPRKGSPNRAEALAGIVGEQSDDVLRRADRSKLESDVVEAIEREIAGRKRRSRGDKAPGYDPGLIPKYMTKSTPGRRKALKALAAAKKRNKTRMSQGKKPIVEGKPVSPSSLRKDATMDSNEAFDILAKGLVEADVFVDTATGADLRGILPKEVVEKFDDTLSAESAGLPDKESDMPDDTQADQPDDILSPEQVEEVLAYVEELETELEQLRPVEEAEEMLVSKALSELPVEVAAIVKADRERLEKAEAALEAQREAAADAAFIAKAATYDAVIEDANEFGPLLRQLNDFNPELASAVEGALATASARVEKSALLGEVGANGVGPTNAQEEVTVLAKRMVEADPSKSLEEAEATIWEKRPDLYDQYQNERKSALRNA